MMAVLIPTLLLGTVSCKDSFIYQNQGDCSTKVQFVLKKHRQALHAANGHAADAFYSTVGSVHLFIFDAQTGELVFEQIERTDNLKTAAELNIGSGSDRNMLAVNLDPGKYKFVAWCGLDENDHNNAFNLENTETRGGYSHCRVKHNESSGHPVNHAKYESVYHGVVESAEVLVEDNGMKVIPIELTKNNNDIAIWVQHNERTFGEGEYEVVYVDRNGEMKFDDNTVSRDDKLEYHAHTTSLLTSETEYNGDLIEAGALVAHISTSRLIDANKDDARLEVRNNQGRTVFSIPFIKYVLQMQTFTNDSQYYLDCEDTFNCSFYITGDEDEWTPARIIINNWVIVPNQNAEI